jgi:hypothetical protein
MGEITGMCHPRGGFVMSMATDKGSTDALLEKAARVGMTYLSAGEEGWPSG